MLSVQSEFYDTEARLTLDLGVVPGLGTDCVSTDASQDRRATETVCCTGDSDTTSGSHEVGCALEKHRALGNSHHMTSQHTCTPEHKEHPNLT